MIGDSRMRRAFGCILLLALPVALAGCQLFGPSVLKEGRISYNRVIQDTQKTEVFSNFIRVLHQEPTLFLGVTEIDASGSLQGSFSPQVSSIGVGAKMVGDQFSGPNLSYTEQPIIKYVPLSGQELIAQIAKPITPESLADLLDSDWNLVPVMSFTLERITPQFLAQGAALNAIAQIYDYKAVVLASIAQSGGLRLYLRPEFPSIAPILDQKSGQIQAGQTDVAGLMARRNILHLWIRLLRIYENTQSAKSALCPISTAGDGCLDKLDAGADRMDDKALNAAFAGLPSHIDLSNAPEAGANGQYDSGPILHTRTALGVLKAVTRSGGTVREFKMDEPGQPEKLAAALQWAAAVRKNCLLWPNYYVFAPSVTASSQGPDYTDDQTQVAQEISRTACLAQTLHPDQRLDVRDFRALRRETMLAASRAFVLFESSTDEPDEAYVSYYDAGRWYWISKDDGISKQNLLLLLQLLTMQAVPSENHTSPVALTVGGG